MTTEHRIEVEVPDEGYWRRQVKCQDACPVHTDARGYVRAIARGDFEEAYLIARGPNPLASICGRVCGAPCEAACRRSDIDQALSIRALKRFASEQFGAEAGVSAPLELLRRIKAGGAQRQCSAEEELAGFDRLLGALTPAPADGPKVAIIGSGPAGLAAAHDLALLGCCPVVFEMEPVPAGMLAVGIPAYRLPRDLIQAEVALIEALGVEFRCNTEVGKDISFDAIRAEFGATIIAVGAKRSRMLELPGADGPGVLGGVEFLRDISLDRPVALGQQVVVIGGGNVAYDVSRSVLRQAGMDVSRTALRQSEVRRVNMVSLESLEEMPADDVEIIEGEEEGVARHHRWGPLRFMRDDGGRLVGVVFQLVLQVFDDDGRFAPKFDADQTLTIEADTVLWAIGQRPDLSFVPEASGVERDERGLIRSGADGTSTSAADVFLAGDIAYGPRLLIDAVASGKQTARTVYRFLTGKTLASTPTLRHEVIPDYRREADYEKQRRVPVPTLKSSERVASQQMQVERGYTPESACREAGRCLDCGVNTIFDSDKCILCGGCADVCPELCLRLVSVTSLSDDEAVQQAVAARYDGEDLAGASAIIKDESRCIRCALCAQRCPVGAITMERLSFAHTWEAHSAAAT